ncbi:hypothetical protein OG875_27375 [Streptomyces sp. NBC_01498]|uniref:hypothetical protein n=1 Tax=Streptomyces sp. NBC_01498 TaxID=2975870 RepID=UPI002E7B3FBB|nr:hypothetical protein [Streptomyces sp. NBC_01498]WTL27962.1 hypothetical protein OG875_27375 [Streptomyces sp. NBC_01498]
MRVQRDVRRDGEDGTRPVLLVAGLAELAVSTCGSALKAAYGLLGRSDLGALAAQGRQDLQARGRLAVDRLTGDPLGLGGVAHMEVLARHSRHTRHTQHGTAAVPGAGAPGESGAGKSRHAESRPGEARAAESHPGV